MPSEGVFGRIKVARLPVSADSPLPAPTNDGAFVDNSPSLQRRAEPTGSARAESSLTLYAPWGDIAEARPQLRRSDRGMDVGSRRSCAPEEVHPAPHQGLAGIGLWGLLVSRTTAPANAPGLGSLLLCPTAWSQRWKRVRVAETAALDAEFWHPFSGLLAPKRCQKWVTGTPRFSRAWNSGR